MSEANTPAPTPTQASPASTTPAAVEAVEAVETVEASGADDVTEVDEAKTPKSKEQTKPSNKRKYQLKVDGQTFDEEIDLDDEESIKTHLQMSKAAQKRMQEHGEYKKNVNQLFELLKTDPLRVINDPRLNIPEETRKKMAEAIINNEIEEMHKTPEQKENERIRREYEALKQQHEEDKKMSEENTLKSYREQAANQLDLDLSSAIKNTAGLPKTSSTVQAMAQAMIFCLDNNIDMTAQDIAPYVKKYKLSEFQEIASGLSDDEFEEWIGKDNLSRLRKRNVAKMKAAAALPDTSVKQTGATEKSKQEAKGANEKVNLKTFLNSLGKY